MGGIIGGGSGGGSSSSKSGYSALPKELQLAFNKLGLGVEQFTNPNNAGVKNAFTPMGVSTGEQGAIDAINRGFAPNAQQIQSDIALQMNPFDDYVIGGINREAGGDYSILKQALSEAGQQGSNRQALGANDIDLTRLNQIGQFKQSQYNTALQNALSGMPTARAQDAMSQLGVGDFLRQLDMQTKQAPVAALQAGTGMVSPFVEGGTQTQKTSGDTWGSLGSLASGISTAYKAFGFSDRRLKENIIPIGIENGYKIYEFNYIGLPQRFIGVMADEVPQDSVIYNGEFAEVNYSRIGVRFREANYG